MEKNVGKTDKVVRLIVGIILLLLGIFSLGGWLQVVFIIVGAILVITGLISRCLLYIPFGISTCKTKPSETGGVNN